nr:MULTISPECIES: hypothetical protein [Pantoea]
MAAQINFCVVGHHSRRDSANALGERLNARLFIDEERHGSNWNHRRALEWAATQSKRVIVLEDDALPVNGFEHLAESWLDRFPDNVVSFYLGTGRPPHRQLEIAMRLIDTDKFRTDYIWMNRLIHGVCYSIPPAFLKRMLLNWNPNKGADYAISDVNKGKVIYPAFSLVEHADLDVVERHPDGHKRTERRKAWRLHEGIERWPD